MQINTDDNSIAIILTAISNPKRLQILDICEDWKTIKEISNSMKLSEPSTHIHVAKLVIADLLEVKKIGRRTKVYKQKQSEICICLSSAYNKVSE